jgi:hypothetical protein
MWLELAGRNGSGECVRILFQCKRPQLQIVGQTLVGRIRFCSSREVLKARHFLERVFFG